MNNSNPDVRVSEQSPYREPDNTVFMYNNVFTEVLGFKDQTRNFIPTILLDKEF